ncbi:cell division protein FtsL [bacterium BMS3Abin04]|nr:cell division protein FtsL [bacterium BMS3Abin04]
MSKIKFHFICLLLLISTGVSVIYGQSDYKITQNFKSKQKSFEVAIEYAKNLKELNNIKVEIEHFREEFLPSKKLLDKALYPENFNSSFEVLENKLNTTGAKLAKIKTLEKNVTSLKTNVSYLEKELDSLSSEIAILKKENRHLLSKILHLNRLPSKNAKTIDSLSTLVAKLRIGITARDSLIMEVMDNIFLAEYRVKSMNDVEKKEILTKIKNTNLIENMDNLLIDNIDLLSAGVFQPEDLESIKDEQSRFKLRWEYFGPRLATIYTNDGTESSQISTVDSLINKWANSIDSTFWRSINNIFKGYNIDLGKFSDGTSFQKNAISYIDEHINDNSQIKPIQNHQDFVYFQTAWTEEFSNKWAPILIKDKLYSQNQKTVIEEKLSLWKSKAGETTSKMVYILIVFIIIIALVAFFIIYRKKKTNKVEITTSKPPKNDQEENKNDS